MCSKPKMRWSNGNENVLPEKQRDANTMYGKYKANIHKLPMQWVEQYHSTMYST